MCQELPIWQGVKDRMMPMERQYVIFQEAGIQVTVEEYTSGKKTIGDVILKYWNGILHH